MSLIVQKASTGERWLEELLRSSDRNAVPRDHNKVGKYSGSVDDQTLIDIMAGEL